MSSQIAEIHISTPSLAEARSAAVFSANLAAMELSQPAVADELRQAAAPEVRWVFGRDGSLTARDAQGHWWGGSSLPLNVARALMKTLEVEGQVGCMLAPGTAGQIRAALERLQPSQAVVAIVPDQAVALVALGCEDFSGEIASGRLFIACGGGWERQLTDLLTARPGLCIPQQYIRTGLLEEAEISALVAVTNPIFAQETAARGNLLAEMRRRGAARPRRGRVCFIAGSTFRLWDLAGPAMVNVLAGTNGQWVRVDTGCPTSASPLALALAAEECDAVVAADLYRADLPGVVADDLPWITWATRPRWATPQAGCANDAVLVADESWRKKAAEAGWKLPRVAVAGWPEMVEASEAPAGGPIALIADAALAPMPERLKDFSSHGVLWDQICADLADDPLRMGSDIDAYLSSQITRYDIDPGTLNRNLFRDQLILPAWRRGIARVLIKAGLPVMVFGDGWEGTEEFDTLWGGEVRTMEDLRRAARSAAALVYPSPGATAQATAHAIDGLGRPVIRPAATVAGLVRNARAALQKSKTPGAGTPAFSASIVLSLLPGGGEN